MDKYQLAENAWPLLVEVSKNGNTISYSGLAKKLESGPSAMRHPLDVIQKYCLANNLPPLTSIVIQKGSDRVGAGYTATDPSTLKDDWEDVWKHAWIEGSPRFKPTPYWVFVCNPKKWAIDDFFADGKRSDSWGVRESDADRFAPGQLAIVRVGLDRRSRKTLKGKPRLEAGIYAICQIESRAYQATGAGADYWSDDAKPMKDRPTVDITYLETFLADPLTIDELKRTQSGLSALVLNGFQARSFPISELDFQTVVANLGIDPHEIGGDIKLVETSTASLDETWDRYKDAAPSVKEKLSRQIERGNVGKEVKAANGFRCQICDGLGLPSIGFSKPNGQPYVEAHHVVQVSTLSRGALSHRNVITACPNHHREIHYGKCVVTDVGEVFIFEMEEGKAAVPKFVQVP